MDLKHIAARQGRLSSFLREEMGMSAGLMNRLKWKDRLFVNGIPVHTDYTVRPGDVITVPLEEPVPEYPAENEPISILYEDDHLLAVEKPAGMLIHPSRSCFTGTLANRVLGYYRQTGQMSAFHPLTRLDRDTFGVVLLAKNAHIHKLLHEMGIQKTYHALVYGTPGEKQGVIDAPIARKPLPSLQREVHAEGKPSRTEFRVLEEKGKYSRLELRPITGRTHQLRLHCAYKGFPILGDPQYGSPESQSFSTALGLTHQLLCAKEVEFIHPVTGETVCFRSQMECDLPEGMTQDQSEMRDQK